MPCVNLVSSVSHALSRFHVSRLPCLSSLMLARPLMSRTLRGLHDVDVDLYFNIGIDIVIYIVVCPSTARAARSPDMSD